MLITLYLAGLIAAIYWSVKILGPEFAKPTLPPMPKPTLGRNAIKGNSADTTNHRLEKLEILLVEKNKNIELLQKELRVFQIQVRDSDKVKTLLLEEVHRLREQNQIFRSELGLPSVQPIENSIT